MARAPGTTAGDTAEFVVLPAVSLFYDDDHLLAAARSSALRLHPWREGGIGVAPAIILWFIPVLVSFILIALFFGGGGSHACLESSPLIGTLAPWNPP